SPPLLRTLTVLLRQHRVTALPLLLAGYERYPDNFWLAFELGNTLLDAGRYQEAVGYFRAALALRPGTHAVLNHLGLALLECNRLDEALALYDKILADDPVYVPAHNNRGIVLRRKGQPDRAIAAL